MPFIFRFPALPLPFECVYWENRGSKLFLVNKFLDLEDLKEDCALHEDLDP